MKFVAPKKLSKAAYAIHKRLVSCANKKHARKVQSFFKTGPGQYGEGDVFLGITAPVLHTIAKEVEETVCLDDVKQLIQSPYHEQRFVALGIIKKKYESAAKVLKRGLKKNQASRKQGSGESMTQDSCAIATSEAKEYYETMKGLITPYVNNWDLVDCFIPHVMGHYLASRSKSERQFLYTWAKDKNIWKRRSAVMTTWGLIRVGEYSDALTLCKMLLNDDHDLMHKATGWMLREIGRNEGGSRPTLTKFLKENVAKMPRTMLQYSIEHLDAAERKKWIEAPSSKKGIRRTTSCSTPLQSGNRR